VVTIAIALATCCGGSPNLEMVGVGVVPALFGVSPTTSFFFLSLWQMNLPFLLLLLVLIQHHL